MTGDDIKSDYDFSEGIRGKFYRPDMKLNIPISLDEDTMAFILAVAEKKKTEPGSIVNELIRAAMRLMDVTQ